MELDDLKNIWKQQDDVAEETYSSSKLVNSVDNKMSSLEKKIKKRDRLEFLVSVFLIVIFSIVFFMSTSIFTQIGCGIVVLSCIYISYRLKTAQIKKSDWQESFNHSLHEHIQHELKQIRRQKRLLENIVWWYIAPITIGLIFITIGGDSSFQFKVIYLLIVGGIGIIVWKYNQRSVRKKFNPLIQEFEQAIKTIEQEEKT
ncbi:MAG: hypothetical protein U5J95_09145 [Balneolaceae bacterium]|nr:hypothetical protein [Balneolaceae bacterium]